MGQEKICPNCKEIIEEKRKDSKFCSPRCRKTYWARMKRLFPQGKPAFTETKNKGPIKGSLEEVVSEPIDTSHATAWKRKLRKGY